MVVYYAIEAPNPYRRLRAALARWADLSGAQWEELAAVFRPERVDRNDYLLLPGSEAHPLYFVCEGLLRVYYLGADGLESNKAFVPGGTFTGPLAAFLMGKPSLYGIQAIEPTTLLGTRHADFRALFDRHPVFDRLGRLMVDWSVIRKEMREKSLLQESATERYLGFLESYPDLTQRIPQYHIASYLGITDVSLSRLRRRLADGERS